MKTLKLTKQYDTYPEYKDSGVEWLGEIPKDWEAKKVSAIFDFSNDKVTEENYEPLSVTYGGIKKQIENAAKVAEGSSRKLVKIGDIAINGRSDRKGAVGMSPYEGAVSLVYNVLRKRDQNEDSKYYHYLFRSRLFSEEFYRWGRGIVDDLWTTRESEMKRILITQPPKQNQQSIATYLDEKTTSIDSLIKKKKKLIALLREKRTAVINQAVTKGLDPDVALVDSGVEWIGKIPKRWELSSLKTTLVSKITDGPHTTPKLLDVGVEFISAESIQSNNTIDFKKRRGFISHKDHIEFCRKAKPQKGDVFMVKSGATTGRVAVVDTDKEFSIWSPLALMRPNKKIISSEYLYFFLQSDFFQDQVRLSWSFGTQQNIGMRVLENLKIMYPDTEEQDRVIKYLSDRLKPFNQSIKKVEKSIELLQEFKSSLISHVVTGKVKV
jgi:type I restriction enzyme S subunit